MFQRGQKVAIKNYPFPTMFKIVTIAGNDVTLTGAFDGGIIYACIDDITEWLPCCTLHKRGCEFGKTFAMELLKRQQKFREINNNALTGKATQSDLYHAWQEVRDYQDKFWKHLGEM